MNDFCVFRRGLTGLPSTRLMKGRAGSIQPSADDSSLPTDDSLDGEDNEKWSDSSCDLTSINMLHSFLWADGKRHRRSRRWVYPVPRTSFFPWAETLTFVQSFMSFIDAIWRSPGWSGAGNVGVSWVIMQNTATARTLRYHGYFCTPCFVFTFLGDSSAVAKCSSILCIYFNIVALVPNFERRWKASFDFPPCCMGLNTKTNKIIFCIYVWYDYIFTQKNRSLQLKTGRSYISPTTTICLKFYRW